MADTFAAEIKEFIVSNFLFGQEGDGLADDQSFLESGIIDSTGLLELVSFVEQQLRHLHRLTANWCPRISIRCATSASSSPARSKPSVPRQ